MANYKIGIEEEYFLVDSATKSVSRAMPEGFLEAAKAATGGQVMGEFLQSQVEVVTLPHTDLKTGARNCATCARPSPRSPPSMV